MAANSRKCLLLFTEFLDIEIALAVKLIPENKGNNIDTNKYMTQIRHVIIVISCNQLHDLK